MTVINAPPFDVSQELDKFTVYLVEESKHGLEICVVLQEGDTGVAELLIRPIHATQLITGLSMALTELEKLKTEQEDDQDAGVRSQVPDA